MKESMGKILKVNISVKNCEQMSLFYQSVFGVKFKKSLFGDFTMFTGELGDIQLTLVPNEISGVSAPVNNIQLGINVIDLESMLRSVTKYGGEIKDPIQDNGNCRVAGIIDPYGNTIEVIEVVS
jgi:predicted enzyme related to lactoylglutathione lyase